MFYLNIFLTDHAQTFVVAHLTYFWHWWHHRGWSRRRSSRAV